MVLESARLDTPIGALLLFVHDGALCGLGFEDHAEGLRAWTLRRWRGASIRETADPAGHVGRLRAYFAGHLGALDEIPVDTGGTPFQQRVWSALREIPVGQTTSYGALAARLGTPSAVRAVGAANGRNPIAIVVPCHRVIASDGTLCGYGGGLPRKQWLLDHEKAARAGQHRLAFGPGG